MCAVQKANCTNLPFAVVLRSVKANKVVVASVKRY